MDFNPYQAPASTDETLTLSGELIEAILDAEDVAGMLFGGLSGVYIGLLSCCVMAGKPEGFELFYWGNQGYVYGSTSGGVVGALIRITRWLVRRKPTAEAPSAAAQNAIG
ncbi:MAG TPA: hypothetical protein VGX76_01590 [Pirellulales bacterium]|jgi:hypothetical protein|nr:hypothetical protein [Pirellulales bacterium]